MEWGRQREARGRVSGEKGRGFLFTPTMRESMRERGSKCGACESGSGKLEESEPVWHM